MTKTRVYELAKELGVDNKVISTLATELGLKGKNSHSSSLQPEEAEAIRRALIRKAVGRDSETVTMRVDKTTGTQQAIVERRKGDVIRRRKQEASPSAPAEEPPVEPASAPEIAAAALEAPPEIQEGTPQEAPEAVAAEESAAPAEPVEEETPPAERVEEPEEAPEVEAAPAENQAAVSAEEAVITEKAPAKPTIGPKVLGRIELPQKKAPPAKSEVRRDGAIVAPKAPTGGEEEEEEDRRKGGGGKKPQARKKGLKREISRIDLIDYEGRDMRRAGKTGGKESR